MDRTAYDRFNSREDIAPPSNDCPGCGTPLGRYPGQPRKAARQHGGDCSQAFYHERDFEAGDLCACGDDATGTRFGRPICWPCDAEQFELTQDLWG